MPPFRTSDESFMRAVFILAIIACAALLPSPLQANDRMAGGTHATTFRPAFHFSRLGSPDFAKLEGLGTIAPSDADSFGLNIWQGSDAQDIRTFVSALPDKHSNPVFFDMQRRILLGETSIASMNRYKDPAPGNDLLTLRIQKLMDMGLFTDAAALYKKVYEEPYHPTLAQTGITALVLNSENALACLEAQSLPTKAKNSAFTQKLNIFCDRTYPHVGHDNGAKKDDTDENSANGATKEQENKQDNKAEQQENIPSFATPLQQAFDDETYMFKPGTPDDLSALAQIDLALLMTMDRLDFSHIAPDIDRPFLISLGLRSETVTDQDRLALMVAATHIGLRTPAQLGTFYAKARVNDPYVTLYKTLSDNPKDSAHYDDYAPLLAQAQKDDALVRFLPLATFLPHVPVNTLIQFKDDSLEKLVFQVAKQNQISFTEKWWDSFFKLYNDQIDDKAITNAVLSYIFSTEPSLEKTNYILRKLKVQDDIAKKLFHTKTSYYEKLDTAPDFVNSDANKNYENPEGLTSAYDYVMHVDGAQNRLKRTIENRELGKVVLLSCIAFRDIPATEINAGSLWEAAKVFHDVGLINAAGLVVREALLAEESK